jgi:hypothetical protein
MMLHKKHLLTIAVITTLFFAQSAVGVDIDEDSVDDRLRVSLAAAEDQSFPETDLVGHESTAVLSFDTVNGLEYCDTGELSNGNLIAFSRISDSATVYPGHGSGDIACGSANQYGGAFATGSYVAPLNIDDWENHQWTLTFTNRQEYVGFWWSAGNDANYVQLLDESGNPILDPRFSAQSLYQTIFQSNTRDCIVNNLVNAYCGNPNRAWENYDYVPQHNFGPNSTWRRGVPTETYAFIHMRYDDGFYGVRFSGNGFELDNVTISEVAPADGNEESFISELPTYSLNTSSVIPVDPRSQSVSFPGIVLGGDAVSEANATMCITQVTDSSGTTPVDAANTSISLTTPANGNVTQSGQPPNFVFSGGQNEVLAFSSQLRIVNSTTNRSVASNGTVWLRVSVSAQSAGGESTCATTGGEVTASVVELRPLRLTNNTMFRVSLD